MELAPLTKKDLKDLIALARAATPGLGFLNPRVAEEHFFRDPDGDAAYGIKAVEKKRLLGAVVGVARKQGEARTGFLKFLAVAPKARGLGHGQLLLSELERRFQKREIREVKVGGCPPPYLQGGVPCTDTATVCFLLKRGYRRDGTIIDMTSDLRKWKARWTPEDKALIKAHRVRKASSKDEPALMEFAALNFPSWAVEIRAGLKQGSVFIAEDGGKIVSFSCADATNPGYYGPTGTSESARGKGFARILLYLAFEALKKKGHKEARIPWVGPIPFYARHGGATLGPIYWTFGKRL